MKERSILWIDDEHLKDWLSTIEALNKAGFVVVTLKTTDREAVLGKCLGQSSLILHCGTKNPMQKMAELLQEVKMTYPGIVIGLQTNAKNHLVEDLVDFYVNKPIRPTLLIELLNSVIKEEQSGSTS